MNTIQSGIFNNTRPIGSKTEFCIVSDMHIGSDKLYKGRSRNDYIFDENLNPLSGEAHTLKRFCEKIRFSGEQGLFRDDKHVLVFLGDIINGEYGYTDCYYSKAYRMLLSAIEPWLYTGNILYVVGNHDKDAKFFSDVAGFPRLSVIETTNQKSNKEMKLSRCGILFEHGHKFDYLCSGKNFLGLMGTIASDIVANLCPPNLEDLLRGRESYEDSSDENAIIHDPKIVTIKSLNNEDRRIANGALNFLSKQSGVYHTIICGHTHQTPIKIVSNNNHRNITYFNTGKFARGNILNIMAEKDIFGRWQLSS